MSALRNCWTNSQLAGDAKTVMWPNCNGWINGWNRTEWRKWLTNRGSEQSCWESDNSTCRYKATITATLNSRMQPERLLQGAIWPNSQIPECTCSISHNAPFKTEMCTFLFWMWDMEPMHSGIREIDLFSLLAHICAHTKTYIGFGHMWEIFKNRYHVHATCIFVNNNWMIWKIEIHCINTLRPFKDDIFKLIFIFHT